MRNFDAVVFDMDGVIFDSEKATLECWKNLAKKYNIDNIEEPYMRCTGVTMARTREIMLGTYGMDFPYDKYAAEASKMFHEKYDGGRLPMKPYVVETLSFLKENGKIIALASSTRKQTVTAQLRDAGIIDFFDEIVCGDMVEKSKPEPDIFLEADRRLGVAPQNSFAVEDSYNGIRAAYAGGLRPVMVPDLLPADQEMKTKAEVVLENLGAFIDYLKGED